MTCRNSTSRDLILRQNLSVLLGISLERVMADDFFEKECRLTDIVYDNSTGEVDENESSYDIKQLLRYRVTAEDYDLDLIPEPATTCNCEKKNLRWNFVILHEPKHIFFILGSFCVKRFDENALKYKCAEPDCKNTTKRNKKHCKEHQILCTKCNKYHLNSEIHNECRFCNKICYGKICNSCLKKQSKKKNDFILSILTA